MLYFSLKINILTNNNIIAANDLLNNEFIKGVLKYLSKFIITIEDTIVIKAIIMK
jgi:hypothetical protein